MPESLRRYVIIEDEIPARDNLLSMIARCKPEFQFAGWADSIAMAKQVIEKEKPSLVFSDVNLSDGNVFELFNGKEKIRFEIIFITGHEEFAIRAFKVSASDYLLKPFSETDLLQAIQKAEEKFTGLQGNREIETLLFNQSQKEPSHHRITIPTTHGHAFFPVSEVIRLEADNSYSTISLTNGRTLVACRSIGDFENILGTYSFFRVHKSHLINMIHIREYLRIDGGYLVMADGARVEISRRKKDELLEMLGFKG